MGKLLHDLSLPKQHELFIKKQDTMEGILSELGPPTQQEMAALKFPVGSLPKTEGGLTYFKARRI